MEPRFQVFVSSTYKDLSTERLAAVDALIKLGFIAVGMEQFPATDESQMDYIKPLIDESDYYILILKGRYGAISVEGKSFTELEYDYAEKVNKPIVAFLYRNEDALLLADTDRDPDCARKLKDFKAQLQAKKVVRYWDNKAELCDAVRDTVFDLVRRKPGIGWVRGDKAADVKTFKELSFLKEENAKLNADLEKARTGAATLPDRLSHGDDPIALRLEVKPNFVGAKAPLDVWDRLETTWDEVLSLLVESLYAEHSEDQLKHRLAKIARAAHHIPEEYHATIVQADVRMLRHQFEALGLIETYVDRDGEIAWKFTGRGKLYISNIRAIKRTAIDDDIPY